MEVTALKNWLTSYREMSREIDSQWARLYQMEDKMRSVGAVNITDMPRASSPEQDRLGVMVANYIDLQQEIEAEVEFQKEQKKEIEALVKHLRKSDEKTVIRARYIDSMSWNEINDLLFGENKDYVEREESYMRRTLLSHKTALENIAKVCIESSIKTFCYA